MDRNEYRRALIMLRSLKKGYAGHGRIEVRTLTGRLNVLVTAPEGTGLTQQVALVGRRRGEYYAWPLGSLRRDLRGQAGPWRLIASWPWRKFPGTIVNWRWWEIWEAAAKWTGLRCGRRSATCTRRNR